MQAVEFQLATSKTKHLRQQTTTQTSLINGDIVQIFVIGATHKYLGRLLPGNLENRSETEIQHRLQSAWYNFHKHQRTLVNKNVSVKLRLKLFDAAVSPCINFGLNALPLHQKMQEK